MVHYQKALQIKPNYLEVQNNLAWVLAIAPQASLRNGPQAGNWANRQISLPVERTRSFSARSPLPTPRPGDFPKRWKPRSALRNCRDAVQHRAGRCHSLTDEALSSRQPFPFTLNIR